MENNDFSLLFWGVRFSKTRGIIVSSESEYESSENSEIESDSCSFSFVFRFLGGKINSVSSSLSRFLEDPLMNLL